MSGPPHLDLPVGDLVVRGGRDAAGAAYDVAVAGGSVAATVPTGAALLDATGLVVLPGLLDLQVNGAAGVDVTATPAGLWDVAAALPRYGVTAFLPTVITSDPATRDAALGVLAGGPPPGWTGAVPLGLHLEGPMLAPERRGAHPARWLVDPEPALVAGWSRAAGVAMVTLAPELTGAVPVVEALVSRGVVVSVGHTGASAAQVGAAVAAGARCLTHLGNAMPPMAAREPGPVGAALGGDDLVAGLIVDGHHLAPELVRTAWRALGPARFLCVSDTTAALGQPDGRTRLGDQEVVVADGTVRLDDGTLAGSAASLAHCLGVLARTTGAALSDVVATATTTPADLIGDRQRGRLDPGSPGDLVLVDNDDGAFDVVATVVGGRVVHDRRT